MKTFHFLSKVQRMIQDQTLQITEGTIYKGYIFHEKIGKGGYSSVYRVTHKIFNIDFAAKVMMIEEEYMWSTFQAEVEALKQLDHENIIRLYDTFREDKLFFMILEYCPNGSLMDEMIPNKGLPFDRLVSVIFQIINALIYCHEKNFAHCDLKPQNVLIDKYGRPKLSDFGLTVFQVNEESREFKGTLAYTPPELLTKTPHSKILADIWSLGVMISVLATGKSPWASKTRDGITKEILHNIITIPAEVNPAIRNIIKQTVVSVPASRMPLAQILEMPIFDALRKPLKVKHYRSYDATIGSPKSIITVDKLPMNGANSSFYSPFQKSMNENGTKSSSARPTLNTLAQSRVNIISRPDIDRKKKYLFTSPLRQKYIG